MAKTSASSSLSPFLLSLGRPIDENDLVEVIEQLNYTWYNSEHTHVSVTAGTAGWGSSGNEVSTHNIEIVSATYVTLYSFRCWFGADVSSVEWGANVDRGSGDDIDIRVTIGSATASVLTWDASTGSGWLGKTIALADSRPNWLTVTIEGQETNDNNDGKLISWFIQNAQGGTIPAPPTNE